MNNEIEKVEQGVDAILSIVSNIEEVIENRYNLFSVRRLWISVRKLQKIDTFKNLLESYNKMNEKEKEWIKSYALNSFNLENDKAEEAIRDAIYIYMRLQHLRNVLWIAKLRRK